MTRKEILDAAIQTVTHDRQDAYGTPEQNFELIARFWTWYLTASGESDVFIGGSDVAAMMALLKIARIATGKPKQDNWIDLAGYAACGGELQSGQEARYG